MRAVFGYTEKKTDNTLALDAKQIQQQSLYLAFVLAYKQQNKETEAELDNLVAYKIFLPTAQNPGQFFVLNYRCRFGQKDKYALDYSKDLEV